MACDFARHFNIMLNAKTKAGDAQTKALEQRVVSLEQRVVSLEQRVALSVIVQRLYKNF
jgi:uncharacterized protein YceH (UPF0502 family)